MALPKEQEPTLKNEGAGRQEATVDLGKNSFREGMLARARKLRFFREIDPDMGCLAALNGDPLQGPRKSNTY